MHDLLNLLVSSDFYQTALQLSTPLIFAALAALVSNKAGVLNISIEGTMLLSALAGAIFSTLVGNAYFGLLMSALFGVVMGLIFALCTFILKTHHILVGIALNIFATGLAIFIVYAITGNKSDYPSVGLATFSIPLLKDIPFIGAVIFTDVNILTILAILSIIVVTFLLNKTVLGLRIRSVGTNEIAAKSVGINPNKTKIIALLIAGFLAGLGGAYMSLGYMSSFNTGMIAGRGFIGIAAEAIGGGNPLLTSLFAFLFGLVNATSLTAQTFSSFRIPYELLNTLPYIVTILGLFIYSLVKYNQKQEKRNFPRRKKNEESLGN